MHDAPWSRPLHPDEVHVRIIRKGDRFIFDTPDQYVEDDYPHIGRNGTHWCYRGRQWHVDSVNADICKYAGYPSKSESLESWLATVRAVLNCHTPEDYDHAAPDGRPCYETRRVRRWRLTRMRREHRCSSCGEWFGPVREDGRLSIAAGGGELSEP